MPAVDPFPWLVFPPAVDLANTAGPAGADLLTTPEQVSRFIAIERGRIPEVEAAEGRLQETRDIRETVRHLLASAVAGRPLDRHDVAQVNQWSANSPTYPLLKDGTVSYWHAGRDPFLVFRGAVAHSAIQLAGDPQGSGLRVCSAPACGMFYLRTHPRQQWCSPACGNRARVARHAARDRAASQRT